MTPFAEPSLADTSDLTQTRLDIAGMTCGACVRRVGKALRAVPGVASADVDLAGACAIVRHDPSTATTAALTNAVERAGYDVRKTTPTP